jgi:kynurenine formamidase
MCSPVIGAAHTDHHSGRSVFPRLGRRAFLKSGALLAGGAAMSVASPSPALASRRLPRRSMDLTHRLTRNFPTFFGPEGVDDAVLFDFPTSGFFAKEWTLLEHIGTHVDSPGHFSEGNRLVDDLSADDLLAPIVVVDIRAKVMDDPNATVEPDDLIAFERRHGRIPQRALVCMDSGWSGRVDSGDAYRGGAGFPDLNFPGFSIDATDWLVSNRDPVGIGVDTLSLDPGDSASFAVHYGFLATGRYGVESLTNLDRIPPMGAVASVGPIPWQDGSGAPCRVLATW